MVIFVNCNSESTVRNHHEVVFEARVFAANFFHQLLVDVEEFVAPNCHGTVLVSCLSLSGLELKEAIQLVNLPFQPIF